MSSLYLGNDKKMKFESKFVQSFSEIRFGFFRNIFGITDDLSQILQKKLGI